MRLVSGPGLLAPTPLRSADPQRIVARWGAAALLVLAPFSLLPAVILPNAIPLAVVLAATAAVLFVGRPDTPLRLDAAFLFALAFVAVGILYVGLSLLEILPVGNQRPVRKEFVPRHSYYVFLWLPLLAGATALFRHTLDALIELARHAGLPLLLLLAVSDVAAAALWGVPERLIWEGYVPFFDPPSMTFLYATCFFLHVAATRRAVLPLAIVTVHAIVSGWTDHGTIYNTMTGSFLLACMFAFGLALRRSSSLAILAVAGLSGGLIALLVAGTALPNVVGFDVNTQWRFFIWRENLFSSLSLGSLGVGFGTPYYPLSPGNVAEAYNLTKYAEFMLYALGSPIDLLYIRAQHSSYVNAFYRMGLLGGGLLIAFNVAVLVGVLRAVRFAGRDHAPLVAAAGAIFLAEAVQIALHVGIESPRYFAAYMLAAGLARAASRAHFPPIARTASSRTLVRA